MRITLALASFLVTASALAFKPGQDNYIVGVDTLATFPSGPFAGQANPNFGRLTLLYAHQYTGAQAATSHYHGKSTFRLARETVGGPVNVYETNVGVNAQGVLTGAINNFVPETAGTNIRLAPDGNGFTSLDDASVEWENLTFRPASWLAGFAEGTSERVTFGSSGGRYTGSLDGSDLALEVVSLTAGLTMTDSAANAYAAGDRFSLGSGLFAATPTFRVGAQEPIGNIYEAAFRVVDRNNAIANSGTFRMRFQTVPEPASMAVLGLGLAALRRRRRK